MNKIGNIITSINVKCDSKLNIVRSIDDIIIDLPTLIIDLEVARKLFPNEITILNKRINEDFFWTYPLKENRNEYEIDIELFTQHCYENIVHNIIYLFVDPIQFRMTTIKKIINKIISLDKPIIYRNGDMLYIYSDNIIYGLDLHLYDFFFGVKKEKIINKLEKYFDIFLDNTILDKYSEYNERLNSLKYIPYIHYLEEFK